MTRHVARASRVTNGPNTHRSLTTHPKPQGSSKFVVYAALAGNLLVSATKFIAASVSGSASMMSEGVHSLVDTLNAFKAAKLNLTWIESFPAKSPKPEYVFFVDFEGHQDDPKVKRALANLREHCEQLSILGSYPMASPST